MPWEGADLGAGAAVEVRFADGVWYRGRLVERVAGTEPPRWKVQFDDGELRDDISLANPEAPVRFDAGAYGATVEVRFAGDWCRGRLVELVSGSDVWGVAFDDGDWAEDVRLGNPDVRYVLAKGAERGESNARSDRLDARTTNKRKDIEEEWSCIESKISVEVGKSAANESGSGEQCRLFEDFRLFYTKVHIPS